MLYVGLDFSRKRLQWSAFDESGAEATRGIVVPEPKRRLFYVALTRPRRSLSLYARCATTTVRAPGMTPTATEAIASPDRAPAVTSNRRSLPDRHCMTQNL